MIIAKAPKTLFDQSAHSRHSSKMCRRLLLLLFLLFCLQFSSILARADDGDAAEAEKTNKIEPEGPNEAETDAFKDPSGGFGTDIDWVPWPQAVSVALDLNRPIFLLIHKSWCGACQARIQPVPPKLD
uniref:Thioredoxin domain-containing protein n=1 Tax=Globodera pallida TaxID=36090 RepID=A0A183BR32_GLOPA